MISRRTAQLLGTAYDKRFVKHSTRQLGYGKSYTDSTVRTDELYDFLFIHDYPAWLCNMVSKLHGRRSVLEWVMRFHTGETQRSATQTWSWDERRELGQHYLTELAEDILNSWHSESSDYVKKVYADEIAQLTRSVELDGYTFQAPRLLPPESDVLDTKEEGGAIHSLYASLALANADTAFHHLKLSEDHYVAGRWDDSISNSRKFLECVLQESASAHSVRVIGTPLPEAVFTRPVAVRDYLEQEKLLESKEKDALAKTYGLLSHTGGHPYMAENDQARLLRHLSLTFSQFVLIRLRGSLSFKSAP